MTSCKLIRVLWFAGAIFLLFAHHLCRMLTCRVMLCSVNLISYLKGGIQFWFTSWTAVAGFFFHKVQVLTRRASDLIYLVHNWEHQRSGGKKVCCIGKRKVSCFSADFVCLLGIAHLHTHLCPFPVAEVCPAEEVCCLQDRGPQRLHGAAREGETLPSSGAWRS